MEIPKDNQKMTEEYSIDKGGICGQSCLAVLMEKNVSEVLEDWKKYFEFKGYTPQRDMISYLKQKGYKVKYKKKMGDRNAIYIARVQWIGEGEKKGKPFYGWGHWSEASAHTHHLVLSYSEGRFFCNEENVFIPIMELESYLKHHNGVITSFLEILK